MKERGMLFNSAMVRALLDGCKTQTRRIAKVTPDQCEDIGIFYAEHSCPHGQPGDRIWVRETFQPIFAEGREHGADAPDWGTGEGYKVTYPATDEVIEWIDGDDNITSRCKPSTNMPRWASRILLEIVSVRVEQLQDISKPDALAEGITPNCVRQFSLFGASKEEREAMYRDAAVDPYRALWESTNGPESWSANPWVWVIEFKRISK